MQTASPRTVELFHDILDASTKEVTLEQHLALDSCIPIYELRTIVFDYLQEIDARKFNMLIADNVRGHNGLLDLMEQHSLTRNIRVCVIL